MNFQTLFVMFTRLSSVTRTFRISLTCEFQCVCAVSVFPAEACETIGGESCLADIYPEVRIESGTNGVDVAIKSEESVEREYLEYTTAKT